MESNQEIFGSQANHKRGLILNSQQHTNYDSPKEGEEFLKIEFKFDRYTVL